MTNNVLGWQITDGGNDGLGHSGGNTASEPILSDTDQLTLRRGRHGDGLALHCLRSHQLCEHWGEGAEAATSTARQKRWNHRAARHSALSLTVHSAAACNQRALQLCMHAPSYQASLQVSGSPRAFVEVVTTKQEKGGHGTEAS